MNIREACELVDRVAARFENGDPAAGLLGRLAALVTEVERSALTLGDALPDDVRADVIRLLDRFRAAAAGGNAWLDRVAGPELASENWRQRIRRAYGLPPDD